jgi:peptidoglycan/LPS O-acetylase OafA/YrhL
VGVLRLLLAWLVLFDHARGFDSKAYVPIYGAVIAVKLFFVISGFYMALVLEGKYTSHGQFYLSRALRLAPAYFAVVALTAMLRPSFLTAAYPTSPSDYWANFLVIGADAPQWGCLFVRPEVCAAYSPHLMYVPQIWSVSIEMQLYLLAPFLVRSRATLAAGFAVSIGFLLVLDLLHISHDWDRVVLPAQLLFFCLGIASYALYRRWQDRLAVLGWPLLALLIAVIVISAVKMPTFGAYHDASRIQTAVAIGLALALPAIFAASKSSRLDRFLGKLSYPFYLSHLLIVAVSGALVGMMPAVAWQHVAAYGLLACVVSIMLVLLVENPSERWRAKVVMKRETISSQPLAASATLESPR